MKFTDVLVLSFLSGASAQAAGAPAVSIKDLDSLKQVLDDVDGSLTKLDQVINSIASGGPVDDLTKAAADLNGVLSQSVQKIQQSEVINISQATSLGVSAKNLQTIGSSITTDLENIKPNIQKANLCEDAAALTQDLSTNGKNVIEAFLGKIPEEAQQVANQFTAPFITALGKTAAEFGPGKCVNGGGAPAGATPAGQASQSVKRVVAENSPASDTSIRAELPVPAAGTPGSVGVSGASHAAAGFAGAVMVSGLAFAATMI